MKNANTKFIQVTLILITNAFFTYIYILYTYTFIGYYNVHFTTHDYPEINYLKVYKNLFCNFFGQFSFITTK